MSQKPILECRSTGIVGRNVYGKGIDEPSEWGHREMDGQAREGNGRAERERTSQILMRTDPGVNSGYALYYAQDHEGSVTHLLNGCTTPSSQTGNVIESYKYDAFGAPTFYDGNGNQLNPNCTAYNNRFLFSGREYAATYRGTYVQSFQFYEYRARAYNPQLGRFMSEDPKLFDASDYNLFRYCHNDPVDFTDPMGLDDTAPTYSPRQTALDRVWEMTKWFDRSNTIQGNFAGFAVLSGQSDRDAKGGLQTVKDGVGPTVTRTYTAKRKKRGQSYLSTLKVSCRAV